MDWIFDILQQAPWLIFVLLGIFSTLFKGKRQEEEQQEQQKKRQQQQRQQRQRAASQASRQKQEDYEDYRRESAPKPMPNRQEKPGFDWEKGKLEELEQKIRTKVDPFIERVEKRKEPIRERMSQEVKELSIKGQEISKDSPILKGELQLSEGKVVNSRHRIRPNRVVEGVMWSEILGQPRSRNPHRPVYAEHFSKRK